VSTIRIFVDDCVIYRKIINNEDIENLQIDLDRRGDWTAENAMKINPSKCKARVKDPLIYTLGVQLITEASSCRYLRITIRNDLTWADHISYTVKKAWKALHFIMRILMRENSCTKI
jgi:hypothetical protein